MVKHAGADTATVDVRVEAGVVSDDGAGFDPDAEHAGHLGLSTMAQRAEAIGADLSITSTAGTDTTVAVALSHPTSDQGVPAPDAR